MKKITIRIMKWIIGRMFGEYTPPEQKSSDKNYRLAKALLALDDLIEKPK